jgi:uncharacterized protein with beta-barrel porin domain
MTTAIALLAAFSVSAPAGAADVSISSDSKTPVVTSTADGGNPANVTVENNVDLTVPDGAAITLDSNNTVVNEGNVTSNGTSDATGILIDTGASGTITGTVTQSGSISAGGSNDNDNLGSNNTGILVGGNGTFVGSINNGVGEPIGVVGDNSAGIAVRSTMTGDITANNILIAGKNSRGIDISGHLNGNILETGAISLPDESGNAIAIDGEMTGHILNQGTMLTGSAGGYDSKGHLVDATTGGPVLAIGGRLDGGFLNDFYYIDQDNNISQTGDNPDSTYTTGSGSLTGNGGATAILVSPTGNADAFVGAFGTGDDAYGLINEGTVTTDGQIIGLGTSTVSVKGATVGGAFHNAVIDGGIFNRAGGTISASAIDADAAPIDIGAGGIVPWIRNEGILQSDTYQSTGGNGGPGGNAFGIVVREGATVGAISNSGTIQPTAAGSATSAYGIIDYSGSVTSLANSGNITPGIAADSSGDLVAIDLSRNTSGVTFTNSDGAVTGEVRLGDGSDTLNISGGSIVGALSMGGGADTLNLSGTGSIQGGFTSSGSLAISMSGSSLLDATGQDTLHLRSLDLSGDSQLSVTAAGGKTSLDVAGVASFTGNARLVPVFTNIISDEDTVTIVSADSVVVSDPANLITAANLPYFYTVENTTIDSNTISIDLKRKTATELGLSSAPATLYDHSINALNSDTALATAVGNIKTKADFTSAYRQMEPPSHGSAIVTSATTSQDMAFGIIAQRMDAMRDARRTASILPAPRGFWMQEAVTLYDKSETANDPGFDGHTIAFALGVDKALFGFDAIGIGFTQGWSSLDKDLLPGRPLNTTTSQLNAYASWSSGPLFVHAMVAGAYDHYKSERELVIGDFDRTAKARWSGHQWSANLRAGYEWKLGSFMITPSDDISYLKLHQNDYDENGGGGMDLSIDSMSFTSTRNAARLSAAYYGQIDEYSYLKAEVRGGWIRNLKKGGVATTGRFSVDGDDNSFTLETDPLADNTYAAGLSLAYVSGETTLSLSYDYADADALTTHAMSLSWYLKF